MSSLLPDDCRSALRRRLSNHLSDVEILTFATHFRESKRSTAEAVDGEPNCKSNTRKEQHCKCIPGRSKNQENDKRQNRVAISNAVSIQFHFRFSFRHMLVSKSILHVALPFLLETKPLFRKRSGMFRQLIQSGTRDSRILENVLDRYGEAGLGSRGDQEGGLVGA